MDLFDRLKAAALPDWNAYVDHRFVRQMGEGTLPEPVFRTYLVQDYLFLIQFARAWALAAYLACLALSRRVFVLMLALCVVLMACIA